MANKSKSKVKVAIRLRPALRDKGASEPCVRGIDNKSLEIWNWRDMDQCLKFQFDAFFGDSSKQKDVYTRCVKPLVGYALNGQNVSVFAYGPTGAGKTHTMLGTSSEPGIIPRTLQTLFQGSAKLQKESPDCKVSICFSYLEIYQEKVYDLLEPKPHDLPIREDKDRKIFISNLAEKEVSSLQKFQELFIPASKNRTTAATKLNSRSSRSHSIVLIKITKTREISLKKQIQTGKMYLIDLAGSENNKKTGNEGIRLKESGAINTSLFVLGQVVDALNQGLPRIPYRDSKLTRLLQDSLGGSAHACMITNIAPEEKFYMETYTTLNFASKSRQIINRPFTQEKTEMKKRSISESSNEAKGAPSKKRKTETPRTTPNIPKAGPKEDILSPLLRRQEHFEEAVRQRLEALEKNLLNNVKKQTVPRGTGGSFVIHVDKGKNLNSSIKPRVNSQTRTPLSQVLSNKPATKAAKGGRQVLSEIFTPSPPCSKSKQKLHDVRKTPPTKFATATVKLPKKGYFGENRDGEGNMCNVQLDPSFQAKHLASVLHILNTGTMKQLRSLQSVGEKRAQLIFTWRQMYGQFTEIQQLKNVPGLTEKTVNTIVKNNLLSI